MYNASLHLLIFDISCSVTTPLKSLESEKTQQEGKRTRIRFWWNRINYPKKIWPTLFGRDGGVFGLSNIVLCSMILSLHCLKSTKLNIVCGKRGEEKDSTLKRSR